VGERRLAVAVGLVDVGTGLDQQGNRLGLAGGGRTQQWGPTG